jgi:hypothetical protein
MKMTSLSVRFLTLCALLLFAAGCTKSPPLGETQLTPTQKQQTESSEHNNSNASADTALESGQDGCAAGCPDARTIRESERSRASCFHLQPGGTVKITKESATTSPATKVAKKKGQKTTGKTVTATKKKVHQTTGRCQPQSLIYARCRTGIMTCRLGDTSPVQWFACAKKNKATTSIPRAGSVIVLDVNTRRGMPTGHPAYVEEVKANKDGTWMLRISHTNYDRKCHLDLDAKVLYHPKNMTVSFQSGPWGPWAKDLKALGFILR